MFSVIPNFVAAFCEEGEFSRFSPLDSFRPSRARKMRVVAPHNMPLITEAFTREVLKLPPVQELTEALGIPVVTPWHGYDPESVIPLGVAYFQHMLEWNTPYGGNVRMYFNSAEVPRVSWTAPRGCKADPQAAYREGGISAALEVERYQLKVGEQEFSDLAQAIIAYAYPNWEYNPTLNAGLKLAFDPKRKTWVIGTRHRCAFHTPEDARRFVEAYANYSAESLHEQVQTASAKFSWEKITQERRAMYA